MQHRPISYADQRMEALSTRLRLHSDGSDVERPKSGARGGPDRGRARDRDFAALLDVLRPRIRRLVIKYGMLDMVDDAEQAAAIGVHRALETYDPAQASFATHATWQMRGELQSLRHRMRLDQRRSAKSAGVTTVSLDGLADSATGLQDPVGTFELVDETALRQAERAASDHMAAASLERMLNRLGTPISERAIVEEYVLGDGTTRDINVQLKAPQTTEQRRQIVRRTLRNCEKMMAGQFIR